MKSEHGGWSESREYYHLPYHVISDIRKMGMCGFDEFEIEERLKRDGEHASYYTVARYLTKLGYPTKNNYTYGKWGEI